MGCINLKVSQGQVDNAKQKQLDIVRRMVEKKTSAEKLKSFIKKINTGDWDEFINLPDDKFITKLEEVLIDKNEPKYKQQNHRIGRPLLTLDDFNRGGLTSQERKDIKEAIKFNVVDKCLFDISEGTGEIRSLEKINENILKYKLQVMLSLAKELGIKDAPIKSIDDIIYHPQNNGESLLQEFYDRLEYEYGIANSLSSAAKLNYNILTYFDAILLSTFENVIELDPEYEDDGYIYVNKYIYRGPGANMRKGFQDNLSEGYADAFENMANLTKMVVNFIPRYAYIDGSYKKRGYVGEENAVILFAELWDFIVNTYKDPIFKNEYPNRYPKVYLAITSAIDNPASADWGVIVNHYINTKCAFANLNYKECMYGLYKHVFEKGKGTWLYENFVSCIQKYRRTYYGIISKVRKNGNSYMEFNELSLWTEQRANFQLQDQLSHSANAAHVRYDTKDKQIAFAKQLGLKWIDANSFSLRIDGQTVTVTINKAQDPKDTKFSIDIPSSVSNNSVLKFMLVNMNINISKDALEHFQTELHSDDLTRHPGEISVKPNKYFRDSVAPLFALWINSVFDKELEIDGATFKPIMTFDKKRFGDEELNINSFSSYYKQLWPMASIFQIVHNENTSNVIKNGKGNNVPTTQLATIQQDGPVLFASVQKKENVVAKDNREKYQGDLNNQDKKRGTPTSGFKSISAHNPTMSQPGFCKTESMLSAGITNSLITKESKELKAGELLHNEIIYLFAQNIFGDSKNKDEGDNKRYIYSQSTANADKNLQTLRGLALDVPIAYTEEVAGMTITKYQNRTLRSIIQDSMRGDDRGIYEYYALHNAKAILALENNICHSYNCAFVNDPDWIFVNDIESLMSQLAKKRYEYLHIPIDKRTSKFDWTLKSIKQRFKESNLDFNETTFGIEAVIKGAAKTDTKYEFECVQFAKDMVRDMQIAKKAVKGDFTALKEQSFYYERTFIQDLISENCDINTLTDAYFKEMLKIPSSMMSDWVTKSGDMILATFEYGGRTIRLTSFSNSDDIKLFKNDSAQNVKINPILHAYHNIQFAVNTQMTEGYNGTRFSIGVKTDKNVWVNDFDSFEILTMDTPALEIPESNKEIKKKLEKSFNDKKKEWRDDYLKIENARMVNYYKRATVNGTREHRILHGGKYNIPEEVHIATIEDPEVLAILNSDESVKCKAQDGSIWVTPWHALQMDVGAGEAKLPPGVRKTMYHDIDPITGGATLLKMAEFIITNEMRRLSQNDKMNMEMLIMKLANRVNIKLEPSMRVKNAIEALNSFFEGNVFFEQQKYDLSADDFGKYYAFSIQVSIKDDGQLIFTKQKWEVSKKGDKIGNETKTDYEINSIYQIDRLLGGAYSCDLTKNGLVLGESQNKIVNRIICELDLKSNYTAYAVNKESSKNNIKNVNSADEWYNIPIEKQSYRDPSKWDEKSTLWTSTISTKFGGIILNALHEMDEDVDVARGVQMLSEMIQNGNNYEAVEEIYTNVQLGIQDALDKYTNALNSKDKSILQQLIFDTIIDSLTNGKDKTKVSLAQEFVLNMKAAREEKGVNLSAFPISDKALYDLLITTIVGRINKEGIRARNSGFGGVKHPSVGVATIYNVWVDTDNGPLKVYAKHNDVLNHIIEFMKTPEYNKKYKKGPVRKDRSYDGWTAKDFMELPEKDGVINPFIELSKTTTFDIDLGETILYKQGDKWHRFELFDDKSYQHFKRFIEPTLTECYRDVFAGRRLRGYRTECVYIDKNTGKTKYDMLFNTDSRYLVTSINYVRSVVGKVQSFMEDNALWKDDKSSFDNIMSFIDTAAFKERCLYFTDSEFKENYTIDDLKHRIAFLVRFFSGENKSSGFTRFKNFYENKTGKKYETVIGTNLDVKTKRAENLILFKSSKEFDNVLKGFIPTEKLNGISQFTEDNIFEITISGQTEPIQHQIQSSKIRKAEYMKSKGNVAKQFHMDREDSMFDVLTRGKSYFEDKLSKLYTQPNDPNLLYDVVVYDKARRPIYLKFDPNHKYAEHFVKQKGEYYPVRNSIFKESHGYIYYKDKLVCNSNQMTTWTKLGQNGEKYTVLTVFDRSVFDEILKGTYGKKDGFVSKIVPNLNNNWDEDALVRLSSVDELEFINQEKKKEYTGNNQMIAGLAQLNLDDYYKNLWAQKRGDIAKQKYSAFIRDLVKNHLIDNIWEDHLGMNGLSRWMRNEATQMYNSFLKQRSAIGTRIPSQAMQSMMAMECVAYIDADYNEEMASAEMTYIQGSDYDIDKDYITEYFIDESGMVADGSKLQYIEAFAPYVDSFPVPNAEVDEYGRSTDKQSSKIKYAKFASMDEWVNPDTKNVYTIPYNEAVQIINWINNPTENEHVPYLFKSILDAVNSGKKLHIGLTRTVNFLTDVDKKAVLNFAKNHYAEFKTKNGIDKLNAMFDRESKDKNNIIDSRMDYIISEYVLFNENASDILKENHANYFGKLRKIQRYVNMHQTSVTKTSKDIQNISLSKELDILSNPRNIASMEVSVDLSLNELKAFANEKGVISENGLSVWSAASKFKAQDTNLLGKTGVGVAANADKVYFTVYYYHTKILNNIAKTPNITAGSVMNNLVKVLVTNPFDSKDIRCISKLNWDILKDLPNFSVLRALEDSNLTGYRKTMIEALIDGAVQTLNDPSVKKSLNLSNVSITRESLTFKQMLMYLKQISNAVDGTVLLSALVSAATDNAKELVLSKLNAFGDILDAYGMCATLGIPFEETASIFTSPLLNACVKDIRGDVYDPTNFASKLEGSIGMFFAKFEDPKDKNRINSTLSTRTIGAFTKSEELGKGDPSRLSFKYSGTAVQIIESLKRDNDYIDDLIVKAIENINASKPDAGEWEEDWDEYIDDELESYDDTITSETIEWKDATKGQKIAYVSILKRLKLRNNAVISMLRKDLDKLETEAIKNGKSISDIDSSSVVERLKQEVDSVKNISEKLLPKLYEQQLLHKMLGVTKGIEGQPHKLYRYIRELEYFVNKKYKQAKLKEDGKQLTFNFVEFFKDPSYAEKHIKFYDGIREFTNILECLYLNEYIGEMLRTVGDTNSLLSNISFVYGNTQKIAKFIEEKLELSRPLTQKEFGIISNLVNEFMIHEYLTYHAPYLGIKLTIDPNRGEVVYDGENLRNPIPKGDILRINKTYDIASFKRLSNLFFFPDLLQDYAENTKKFCEKGREANMFIEAIVAGGYSRIVPNANKPKMFADAMAEMVWKVAYNMNEDISDESSEYALQLKRDFEYIFKQPLRYKNDRGEWIDRGITIGDFIYLYNLVVYKNSGTRNSFTKLFENVENLRKSSKLLPQYNAFVAAMDSGKRDFDFTGNKRFIDSVLLKLGAMQNSKLKETIVKKHRFVTSIIKNPDNPFDFTLSINANDNPKVCAEFYDEMTAIITHNNVSKTDLSFEEGGIYYVQESLLPLDPSQFIDNFGDKFVWVRSKDDLLDSTGDIKPKIKSKLSTKCLIVTDPKLAEICWTNIKLKPYKRKGFVHSVVEFNQNYFENIKDDIIQLPRDFTFTTILENTLDSSIEWKRPLILQDAIRRLWDQTSLTKDGFNFDSIVKFETATTVAKYTDHRRFAKAWFDYSNGDVTIHINIDNCNNENVIVHEMAHLLLLMNKVINMNEYRDVAIKFLQNIYSSTDEKGNVVTNLPEKWEEFKKNYPATIPDGLGGFTKLSDDLLFDEFLIYSIQTQGMQNWSLNHLIDDLRLNPTQNAMYRDYVKQSKNISQKIADNIYEIKC